MDDYGFKFRIGDLVEHVAGQPFDANDKWTSWNGSRAKLFIICRRLEECPGGVQRAYDLRSVTKDGHFGDLFRLNEIELLPTTTHAEDAAAIKAAEEARKK